MSKPAAPTTLKPVRAILTTDFGRYNRPLWQIKNALGACGYDLRKMKRCGMSVHNLLSRLSRPELERVLAQLG